MKNIEKKLNLLCDLAEVYQARKEDVCHAREFIHYNEFELSFDTLITQMYEYEIKIDTKTYSLIESIGIQLKLSREKYFFMNEQIVENNSIAIPKDINECLMKFISQS